jgi:hypothetical protein
MNTQDLPGLTAIRPSDVQTYLQSSGWKLTRPPKNDVAYYVANETSSVEAQVLLDRSFEDYSRRVAELIDLLSATERRPAIQIVEDLLNPAADKLRVRLASPGLESGTISLDDSIRVRAATKDLLLSSAHSAIEPRPHFPRLGYSEATKFLSQCREGQTARGSYVTTVVIPVSPEVTKLPLEDPFARRVTKTLIQAAHEADSVLKSGKHENLLKRADNGVSSNFLASLADLRPPTVGVLELSISWSRGRTAPGIPFSVVRFDEGVFDIFAEAARELRETSPSPGTRLEGFVFHLTREGGLVDPGLVTVATTLKERADLSSVRMRLVSNDYDKAVDAHKKGAKIQVIGTLRKDARQYWLDEPTGFEIVAEAP